MWFVPSSTDFDTCEVPDRARYEDGRHVYVVLLAPEAGASPKPSRPPVYVGQTGKSRADRFREDKIGYKRSRHVEKYGLRLMPELYPKVGPIRSNSEAEEAEAWWAGELRRKGYLVRGGH